MQFISLRTREEMGQKKGQFQPGDFKDRDPTTNDILHPRIIPTDSNNFHNPFHKSISISSLWTILSWVRHARVASSKNGNYLLLG